MDIAGFSSAIAARRGTLGVRAAARDAGISPATLSRIENGHTPDMETFEKICVWLGADPSRFIEGASTEVTASVQFKKAAAVKPETARALGELVTAVFEMIKHDFPDDASA